MDRLLTSSLGNSPNSRVEDKAKTMSSGAQCMHGRCQSWRRRCPATVKTWLKGFRGAVSKIVLGLLTGPDLAHVEQKRCSVLFKADKSLPSFKRIASLGIVAVLSESLARLLPPAMVGL
jgi:hypothetical protein